MEKSEYLIIKSKEAEIEMIRAEKMKDEEWVRHCEYMKKLEDDVMKSLK